MVKKIVDMNVIHGLDNFKIDILAASVSATVFSEFP
jgi:hypothetical protein